MGDTQLELICYRSYPGVTLCFKHLLWACQVQITYKRKNESQGMLLEVWERNGNGKKYVKLEGREGELKKFDSITIQVTVLMWHIVAHKGPN